MKSNYPIIFETVHGSHLYGLNHAKSDYDIFRVVLADTPKSVHTFDGAYDYVEVGLSLFLNRAVSGSHQSVEALFSHEKAWGDTSYQPMLENVFVGGPEVFAKYERTITSFSYGDFKRRRHACRLALNLSGLRREQRFNPRLTPLEADMCSAVAESLSGDSLRDYLLNV